MHMQVEWVGCSREATAVTNWHVVRARSLSLHFSLVFRLSRFSPRTCT